MMLTYKFLNHLEEVCGEDILSEVEVRKIGPNLISCYSYTLNSIGIHKYENNNWVEVTYLEL